MTEHSGSDTPERAAGDKRSRCTRSRVRGTLLALALAAGCLFAPSAGAQLIHVSRHQVAGVTPVAGINPASIRGAFATQSGSAAVSPETAAPTYHGGPVLHASRPFLIFWDPKDQIPASTKALLERFFTDVAAESGKSSNVFGVDRQYTDNSGFADYRQVWTPSQAITDTQPYPSPSSQCTENSGFRETACLFDGQLQAEIARVVAADGLPTGTTGNAPIYFVVTPPNVNSCMPDDHGCADNAFCAFHSFFQAAGHTVLYADIPTLLAADAPKRCQDDGNSEVQEPNGNQIGDVAIKYMSHEDNETITDPLGNAWYTDGLYNEVADNCNEWARQLAPATGGDPNAFEPTLGGTAADGTLFDQLINGDPYYTQSVWSNGALDCEMQPTNPGAFSAAFGAPASVTVGSAATFNPSQATSATGFTSSSWNFGDGSREFSRSGPATTAHTYAAAGSYTVTLTLVDPLGDIATVSHTVTVLGAPSASFTLGTAHARAGTPISFNASASSGPAGVAITGFSWDFGDSNSATGAAPVHAYSRAGTYAVALTVTDALGATARSSQSIEVSGAPSAVIAVRTAHPAARARVVLSAARSRDYGSSLVTEVWELGDGTTGSGLSVSHEYRRPGRYRLRLTVTDRSGARSVVSRVLVVKAPAITRVRASYRPPLERLVISTSGPGTLELGTRRIEVRHSGTVRLNISLKALAHLAQRDTVRLRFVPVVGHASSRLITVSAGRPRTAATSSPN